MAADPLSCQELVELVTEYLDGALPAEQRLAFEQHIAICPPCRGYLAEIRGTVAVAGELTEDNIPPAARDAMLAVFRSWKEERGGERRSADP
ncbi:MAG: anti-sigma factor family protein [Gaiellaceae bacterium]